MKKLTILTIVIVLLALATPAMSDVVVSGKVKYGVCLGPNTAAGDDLTSTEKQEARITVTGTPDDNNTVTITLKVEELDFLTAGEDAVDKAIFESNLLGALGLSDIPVDVVLTGGYYEAGNADVGKVSKYELEDVINTKSRGWQFGLDVGIMDMVTVRVAIDPTWRFQYDGSGVFTSDTANIGYIMGAFATIADLVSAEFFYTNVDAGADEPGTLGIGVGVNLVFGDIGIDIGANVAMPLYEVAADGTTDDVLANLGIGIGFSFSSLLSASVCMEGSIYDVADNQIVNTLGIAAEVNPIDMLSIGAGVILGLGDVYVDAFQQLDINVGITAGALTLNTGYLLVPTDTPQTITDKFSWTTNGDEGGFYIGGVVEF